MLPHILSQYHVTKEAIKRIRKPKRVAPGSSASLELQLLWSFRTQDRMHSARLSQWTATSQIRRTRGEIQGGRAQRGCSLWTGNTQGSSALRHAWRKAGALQQVSKKSRGLSSRRSAPGGRRSRCTGASRCRGRCARRGRSAGWRPPGSPGTRSAHPCPSSGCTPAPLRPVQCNAAHKKKLWCGMDLGVVSITEWCLASSSQHGQRGHAHL